MYDPNSVEAMVNALQGQGGGSVPPVQPTRLAGDVLPLPITPGISPLDQLMHAGPDNVMAHQYATGHMTDPKVSPMPLSTTWEWIHNARRR